MQLHGSKEQQKCVCACKRGCEGECVNFCECGKDLENLYVRLCVCGESSEGEQLLIQAGDT